MSKLALACLCLLGLAPLGCAVYPMANSPHGARTTGMIYSEFTMPMAVNVSAPERWVPVGRARGTSSFGGILGLVAMGDAGYAAAYQDALEKSGGDALVDTQCDVNVEHLLGIYVVARVTVSGLAVKTVK